MEVASATCGVSELEPVASVIDHSSMDHLDCATFTDGECSMSSDPQMNGGGGEMESATPEEVDKLLEELSELSENGGAPVLGAESEEIIVSVDAICDNISEEHVRESADENCQVQNNTVKETEAEPTVEPSVAQDGEGEIPDVAFPSIQTGPANDIGGENESLESSEGIKETGRNDLRSSPSKSPMSRRRSSLEDSCEKTKRTAVNLKIPVMPTFVRASVVSTVSVTSVSSPSTISQNTLNMNILKKPLKKPELAMINSELNISEATSDDPVHAPDNVSIIVLEQITQSDTDSSKASDEVPTSTIDQISTPDNVLPDVSDNQQTQSDCNNRDSNLEVPMDTVDQANAPDSVPLIAPVIQQHTQSDCVSSNANKSSGEEPMDHAPSRKVLIENSPGKMEPIDDSPNEKERMDDYPSSKKSVVEESRGQMSELEKANCITTSGKLTTQSTGPDDDNDNHVDDLTPNASVMKSSNEKGKESTESDKNEPDIILLSPPKSEVEVKKQYKSEITMAGQQIMSDNYPKTYIKAELNKYKCLVCGQGGFAHINDLRYHREKTHPQIPFNAKEEMPFGCGVCGKPFHLREDALVCALLAHDPASLHKQMFRYACSQCPEKNFRFHSIVALKRHWEVDHCHTFLLSETFAGKGTSQAEEAPLPSVVINETEALKIKAGELPIHSIFPLIVERDLITVENDKTAEEKNHIHLCTICHAMLNNNYELNNHMMKHTAREARKPIYKCNKCPEKFKRLTALRQHFKIHLKAFKKSKRLKRKVDNAMLVKQSHHGKATTLKGPSTASGRIAGKRGRGRPSGSVMVERKRGRGRPRKVLLLPNAKNENVNKTNLKKLANGIMNAIKHRSPRSSLKKSHETDFEASPRIEKECEEIADVTERPASSASAGSQLNLQQLNPLKLFKCNLCAGTGTDPKAFTTFRALQSHKRFAHQLHPLQKKLLEKIKRKLHTKIIKNPGFVLLYDVRKKKGFRKYQSKKYQEGSLGRQNSKAESESNRHSGKVKSLYPTKSNKTESVNEDRNKSNHRLEQLSSTKLDTPTPQSKFQCKVCLRFFTKNRFLKKHEKTHAKKSKTEGVNEDRNKSSHRLDQLSTTKIDTPTPRRKFQCKVCLRFFTKNRFLEKHEKTHTEKPKTEIINEDRNKSNHRLGLPSIEIDTPTPRRKFQCKVCLRFFMKRRFLKKHEKTHTEEPETESVNEDRKKSNGHSRQLKSLDLTKCRKTEGVNEDRNKSNHRLEQPPSTPTNSPIPRHKFQCKVCLRFFKKRRFLNNHEKTHTEQPKTEAKLPGTNEIEVVKETPSKRGRGRPRKDLLTRVSSVALSFMKKTEDSFANERSPQVADPIARKENEITASLSSPIRKGPGRPRKQTPTHQPVASTNISSTYNEKLQQKCTFRKASLEPYIAAQSSVSNQVTEIIGKDSRASVRRSEEYKRESKKRSRSPQEVKIKQTPSSLSKRKHASSISLINEPATKKVKTKHVENVTLMTPATPTKRGPGRPSTKKVASESLGTFHLSASVLLKMKKCKLVLTRCDEFSGKSNARKKTLPTASSSKPANTKLDDVQTQFTRKRKYMKGGSRNDPPKRDSTIPTPLVNPNPVTCQLLMFKKQEHSFERVFPSPSMVKGNRDSDESESSPTFIPHSQASKKSSKLKPGRSRHLAVTPTKVEEEVVTRKRKMQSPSRDTSRNKKQTKTRVSPSSNVVFTGKCQIPKETSDGEKRHKKHRTTTHLIEPRKNTTMEKTGGREEKKVKRSKNRDATPTRQSKKLRNA